MLDRVLSHAPLLKRRLAGAAAAALLAGAGAGLAQAQAHADYAAIDADPALWSISDEDSTVYLFGTVHILPPELDWRTDAVDAALADAEIIYFEADATSPEAQAEANTLIPQLGLNAPGVTLSSMLSEDAKADMAVIAERIGAPPEMLAANLDPLQPWLASLQLAVLQIQAGGYDPASGVEYVLAAEAADAGMEFGYFETIEQQLRFFADLPIEIQLADLETGLDQMVEEPEVLSEIVQAWAAGDMRLVDTLFNEAMRDSSQESFEALIINRNQAWVPLIEGVLAGPDDAFIAVGAGHMPGAHGVIALLEAEGLDVVRR